MNRLKAPHPPHLSSPASGEDGSGQGATHDASNTPSNWLSSALAVWVRTDGSDSDPVVHKAAVPIHTAH